MWGYMYGCSSGAAAPLQRHSSWQEQLDKMIAQIKDRQNPPPPPHPPPSYTLLALRIEEKIGALHIFALCSKRYGLFFNLGFVHCEFEKYDGPNTEEYNQIVN